MTEPGTPDDGGEGPVPAGMAVPGTGVAGAPAAGIPTFGDLYLGSYGDMVRLARVLVDSPETAEDLVQDAFVHLHRRWDGVRDPRSYLHRSVVNACRSHHRRAWRERPRPFRDDRPARPERWEELAPEGQPAADVAGESRADDADVLGAALATLPYRQRAALVLRYYADLPDAEIAMALGCRPGTVASLVHRGLERLRGVVDHD